MKITKSQIRKIIKEELKSLSEARMVQLQIPYRDRKKAEQILKKLRLTPGKDYDYGVGKGATFILELDVKHEDKVLEMLIKNRVQVHGI